MSEILMDLSRNALEKAVKSNLTAFFRTLQRAPTTEFYSANKLARWHTPIAHPWFNGMLSAAPASANEDETIRQAIDYFKSKNVSVFTWWLEPESGAENWQAQLRAHGFGYDSDTPGMAVDLNTLDARINTPPNLIIQPVRDLTTLKTWTEIFMAGYGLPADWAPKFYDIVASLGLEPPTVNYLAYWDGKPVATASLFIAAGVAGVYNVATLPAARGKGIGAAVTLAPLIDARDLGLRVGTLQSSEMGFSVYQRLGFTEVCKIDNFFWRFDGV
jgi:GNAT superfamily N-acetyltransferase